MYYFFPKKSNCNYQGLQQYSSFQKGLSTTLSSFKFNFTFCMAVLSFRHGLQVHQVASKRLKTKG
jgi:amino acid permease